MTDLQDTMRWARRGGVALMLVIGWVFIAWQNRFYISAPVVFVCLGYLAVVATLYNLWRTGVAAVADTEGDDSTWAKPAGALGELEREKRTLLKAIKEAEFDHQMGKLSQRDADDMVKTYRTRAIEVIKEIERLGSGAADNAREQILREVRARLELDAKGGTKAKAKAKARAEAKAEKAAAKSGKAGKAATPATGKAEPAASVSEADAPDVDAEEAAESKGDSSDTAPSSEAAAGPRPVAVVFPGSDSGDAAEAEDDAMNADSTTAVEPRRNDRVKEATP